MFILSSIKDIAMLPAHQFNKNFLDATSDFLNQKYANKVIINLGLVITVWDISKYDDSYFLANDSNAYTRVYFRIIVFLPFVDEIIIGKIKSSNSDGLTVTLGFFDDIRIPSYLFQENSLFDEKEQIWFWNYEIEDESGKTNSHKLYIDIGEQIRFRVVEVIFMDLNAVKHGNQFGVESIYTGTNVFPKSHSPMTIMGSIAEQGLGLVSWWN